MLQPKLNLRVSQRQVLTPGLVQMVSVLALNKLELREMINTEMVENPVLEEVEESSITIDELAGREGDRERSAEEVVAEQERVEKDPFDEVDFGSYFQDYLDPGFKTASNFEDIERPSFENFLSQPSTLTDHLEWQLGSMSLSPELRFAADLVVGNLNADGYLTATDDELVDGLLQARGPALREPIPFERGMKGRQQVWEQEAAEGAGLDLAAAAGEDDAAEAGEDRAAALAIVSQALEIVHHLDPLGIGARDLRECLLIQIGAQRREAQMVLKRTQATVARVFEEVEEPAAEEAAALEVGGASAEVSSVEGTVPRNGNGSYAQARSGCPGDVFEVAAHIVANSLAMLQKKDMRELTKACGRTVEDVQAAVDLIKTLDPRPGQRYNVAETRLIEPDVAFVKRDGEYVVVMNEEEMPTLRLSHAYRKMLRDKDSEKDVKEYVKERYKSAIQLLRNIEQRKNTIVRTCEVIVRRQKEFLEVGEQGLKPMMIKEVAEEIGVHPSTVSRAVSNKYVHTSQGVYELRFFFSEGVNGPEGGDLPLVLLKKKVKKLIEDEDPRKPLTDDHLAAELQRQGIRVTRRTVAKYREDMQIPSTHQRRVR
ncbi:MAG TPA: RNA polymerase sigma-54 factor [Acidobacteriaceae bacterium]|nr:RNA polymerase sigma-54 factor [Acidobacteriaceae bacterium]